MFPIRMRPGISPANTSLSLHLGRSPGTQFMIALLSLLFLAQTTACSMLVVFLMRESSTLMALVQEPLRHIIMVPFSLWVSSRKRDRNIYAETRNSSLRAYHCARYYLVSPSLPPALYQVALG